MKLITKKISGVPYCRSKTRGNTDAPGEWTSSIVAQTRKLPKVKEACILRATFLLPPNKFPTDLPYGPDLDNLMKRLCDALSQTVFSETEGKDSCVIEMSAIKARVDTEKQAGVILEILPMKPA